ncbi:hypothetical protein EDC04DRAFT_845111 [Pisolithus marmoratus]|nr:hypothetical protein EDC04DRAFT_845111 [Pisolithus marmoratus]
MTLWMKYHDPIQVLLLTLFYGGLMDAGKEKIQICDSKKATPMRVQEKQGLQCLYKSYSRICISCIDISGLPCADLVVC